MPPHKAVHPQILICQYLPLQGNINVIDKCGTCLRMKPFTPTKVTCIVSLNACCNFGIIFPVTAATRNYTFNTVMLHKSCQLCRCDTGSEGGALDLLRCERDVLQAQCRQLEQGLYGLPEAVADIQALKAKVAALSESRAGLIKALACLMYCQSLQWSLQGSQHGKLDPHWQVVIGRCPSKAFVVHVRQYCTAKHMLTAQEFPHQK